MILPSPSATTAEYWQAAQSGRLLLRFCDACATWFHPRLTHCAVAHLLSWRESQGMGTLIAHTVVHHALNPALLEHVPYTVTLTRVREGPQLLTSIRGEARGLVCGIDMRVTYDRVTPAVVLPRFVPVKLAHARSTSL